MGQAHVLHTDNTSTVSLREDGMASTINCSKRTLIRRTASDASSALLPLAMAPLLHPGRERNGSV